MLSLLLLLGYVLLVVVLGSIMLIRGLSWFERLDRVLPMVSERRCFAYGFVAVVVAVIVELSGFFLLKEAIASGTMHSSLLLASIVVLLIGFAEEGAKLIPFVVEKGDTLTRWRFAVRGAFYFGIIEAVLYAFNLLMMGNLIAALLRFLVIMVHVVLTAIALESAIVNGSLRGGYVKASLLHAIYDAPVIFAFLGAGDALILIVPLAMAGFALLFSSLNRVFEVAYVLGKRKIEERRKAGLEEENPEVPSIAPEQGDFTFSP
ncbi:hypothetical protein [Thermococcus gammatolerans]|nr:hypothetical protein [Thermococcus gammatolerans]